MNTAPEKTHVLLLITKSNWGGAQRYVFDLATNLPADTYNVTVALGGEGELTKKLRDAGIPVITIPHLKRDISFTKEILASRSIATIIKQVRPNILHVNSSKAGLIGSLLGRLLRVPRVIFTAHGWAFNEDRSRVSRLLLKTLHWLTVLFAHHTITVSAAVKDQLNWWGVQRKMTVVHLGRALPDFLPAGTARTALAKQAPSLQPYLTDTWTVSIGELHPVKQHDVTIEALKEIVTTYPDTRHLIIGEGEERPYLEALIQQSGLKEHVFLLGHIAEAATYLKAADLFIFPSRSEALGYAAIEAMQAGVPVVASNVGGIPEIITHKESGVLCPSGDTTVLTKALVDFLSQPELYTNYAHTASAAIATFSIAHMIQCTINVYQHR